MARLDTPLVDVLGGRTAKALDAGLELRTVGDLLGHYPRRLAERGELTDLASLRVDEDVTVLAEVRTSKVIGNRKTWRERELTPGTTGLFAGKVSVFNNTRQLTHPEYVILRGDGLERLE